MTLIVAVATLLAMFASSCTSAKNDGRRECSSWLPQMDAPSSAPLPGSGGVVVFGRLGTDPTSHATWIWSGSCWTEQVAAGGPAVLVPAMAPDPARSGVLMYGGYDALAYDDYVSTYDTWVFRVGTWTRLALSPAPKIAGPTAMYDARLSGVLVIGKGILTEETWLLSASGWRQIHPLHSPSARSLANLGEDPTTHDIVMYGGLQDLKHNLTDSWRWNGDDWQAMGSPPGTAQLPVVGLLAANGQSLYLFGNGELSNVQVWQWSKDSWVALPVSPPFPKALDFGVAYDGRGILLFGGLDADQNPGTYTTAEWLWGGKDWRRIH